MPTSVRQEIARQQDLDRHWQQDGDTLAARIAAVLAARIAAVLAAREAVTAGELGADWALRQCLVDLASVCELLAGELEPPSAPTRWRAPRDAA